MIKNSKREDFVSLYNKESDAIYRFCLIRVSKEELAIDLTQDTFLKFWNEIVRGEEIRNERALLYSIARNLIIDWYRKKKSLSLEMIIEESGAEEIGVDVDGAPMRIELEAEARYLVDKIRNLEPMYQEVVHLRFVEGLKPKEIAEALGESVNVISVRITRGIQALREITGYDIEEKE